MNSVRPIETRYKGYRFRSRLEARWAVFFDKLGIVYEYEPEGYELPSGARYLPDFFLPDCGLHVEVKPNVQIDYFALRRIEEFAWTGEKPTVLIIGTPGSEEMYLLCRTLPCSITELIDEYGEPIRGEEAVSAFFEILREWGSVRFGTLPNSCKWTLVYRSLCPWQDYGLKEASNEARGARFEFGDTPKNVTP